MCFMNFEYWLYAFASWNSVISDGVTFSTGITTKGTNQIGFPTACLSGNDNI